MNEKIIKYLSGNANQTETKELLDWVESSSANQKEFTQAKSTWVAAKFKEDETSNIKDEYARIQNKIKSTGKTQRVNFRSIVKYAAIFVLAFVSSLTGYYLATQPDYQFETEYAQQEKVELPDGSTVWLNSGSTLSYNDDFGKFTRTVKLKGEAYFDVKKGHKTFVVETGTYNVKVLGTKFNVNAYAENYNIETSLEEGKVLLELKDKELILAPGESGVLNKSKNQIKKFTTKGDRPFLWKKGILSFENDEMKEVALRLERWFDVDIKLKDSEIKNYHFTATFENESLEQVLNLLSISSPINYKINGNRVTIMKK